MYHSFFKRESYQNFIALLIMLCLSVILIPSNIIAAAAVIPEQKIITTIQAVYDKRNAALAAGDTLQLDKTLYISNMYGRWAYNHEVRRVKYLKDWSAARNIKFTNIKSDIRLKKIYPPDGVTKVKLEESYKFDYIYEDDPSKHINSFGVGIRHVLRLVEEGNKILVQNDWYTDCFEDALQSYLREEIVISKQKLPVSCSFRNMIKSDYNRQNAAAYADKYCGAAWGSGNEYKYNNKYADYNGIGGDCTNFASQVLGDKEGGNMPLSNSWFPGTCAWANADDLMDFLLSSGRGKVIKAGTFKELTLPSENLPKGAVGKIQLADLVAYEKGRGDIDHFAVITGFDSKGYPLVNSHTTDRYHVPWDLGWGDKKIRFFLIHIN